MNKNILKTFLAFSTYVSIIREQEHIRKSHDKDMSYFSGYQREKSRL
jgi:hypothetical protein